MLAQFYLHQYLRTAMSSYLDKMQRCFDEWVSKTGYTLRNKNIILAVSGGSDSVAMMYLIDSIRKRYSLNLYVLHVDHGVRGFESRLDALFVNNLSEEFNIPYILREISKSKKISEENLRDWRYKIFAEESERLDADVFIAHTKNDNIETILFNLFRGTGPAGLCGIPFSRNFGHHIIFRPILFADRADLEILLREKRLNWREDKTNSDSTFTRNYIRNEIMPLFYKRFGMDSLDRILNTSLLQKQLVDSES